MRLLSTRRRHPLAGVVVLLLGLLVVGGLYSALGPKSADADTTDTDTVQAGRDLFLVGCASCHGLNAQGVESQDGGNYGPSLIGVGAAAVDFQVGTGRMPMAQPGPQAPRKPVVYSEEEIAQLAAYVQSLGGGPTIPDEESYDTSGLTEEEVAEGGEFFRTNCTACHNSVGAGGALPSGRYAPALDGVGGKYIFEAMLTGPQQMPQFSDNYVTPEQKRAIIAYIESVQADPNRGGFSLGGLGPVSEGLAAWLIGIGGLVLVTVWITNQGTRARKK